jgi:hypothetical protein
MTSCNDLEITDAAFMGRHFGMPGQAARIVAVVVLGPEPPDHGPFGIFAAGLRIEHFPTLDDAPAGPRQAFEAIVLTGRAIAHDPAEDDAPATG